MINISIKKSIKDRTIKLNIESSQPKIYAVVGKSGIGKSTLLNIIAGLTEADECKIIIQNKTLSDGNHLIKVQERKIGYLFQDYQLFPHMTVQENIHYMKSASKETEQLINQLRISNCLNQYPSTLSGGESQRVALCRVLSVKPNLLLLDEPFSSLDDETKEEGMALIKSIFRTWQIPIILVSHSKKEVQTLADEIIEIK
ncbi:ATP-binding cassette domain-containing protein [Mammaliicoccus vitulinus]|uniref:ATP-binding cassette domain-containing protein n=1 Tax=Mammaliicoccus vitulinus TaxID=71237 RepID=A0ABX7HCQ4_9STAP|nr:ATP-binding cassette domain-containing protein [Mammaliicoccus vitulinus]PNZ41062.1 molybdenum ABC transporter ATP-binding protein [Mammaliicoccus vitulinus]QRO84062.1 ATP-binding cassette domain-containing protein [Mammaliicoccus vitulinus]QTN11314.1 ATP-binding cassette domain-containing protein [Mammaliicoccus vitulinus]